jgi:adenine-specific DNA methylase
MTQPRRLIEVDLPIKRISAHARREKSIRHGHISTLHIWWARRPLAACRAVICAALWPDPADPLCPPSFRVVAAHTITDFARRVCGQGKILTPNLGATCSAEALKRWELLARPENALDPDDSAHQNVLRFALLDFIADFANWDNSTVPEYLQTARALTQAAHEALGGEPGTRPLVVDPFAGGGSIPLEALRVGADAFASDLNPVAVLLNKVVLEYIPKYGQKLADEVRKWGRWIKEQAEKELGEFYPKDPDGATPIAYLWARTITCEGPGCGAAVPLIRSLWLAKKGTRSVAVRLVPRPEEKRLDFEIIEGGEGERGGRGDGEARLGDVPDVRVHHAGGLGAEAAEGEAGRGGGCADVLRGDDEAARGGAVLSVAVPR